MECRMMVLAILMASSAQAPAEEKRIYGHRDADGQMVFSDQATQGAQEVRVRQPVLVPGSRLGLKAYPRQTPQSHEKNLKAEATARNARDRALASQWREEDKRRERCAALREIISDSQRGSRRQRAQKQEQYDRECIRQGY